MPKAKKKRKRLLYLKASFLENIGEGNETLEDYLRIAYGLLPLVENRKVEFKDKHWTGTFFQDKGTSFAFQFSASTPGEAATTIPTGNLNVENVELNSLNAPAGFDFSDGDIICLVSKNDVFICASSLRDYSIESYVKAIFSTAKMNERSISVVVRKAANYDKLQLIQSSGVKSVELKIDLGAAEFMRLDRVRGNNIGKKIFKALLQQQPTLAESAHKANSRLFVSLSRGSIVNSENPAWLKDEAKIAIDESDRYKIITEDGKVITESQITVSKYEQMDPFGKSVFIQEAIYKLEAFKNDFLSP
jgi:hypothetical protein